MSAADSEQGFGFKFQPLWGFSMLEFVSSACVGAQPCCSATICHCAGETITYKVLQKQWNGLKAKLIQVWVCSARCKAAVLRKQPCKADGEDTSNQCGREKERLRRRDQEREREREKVTCEQRQSAN